MNQSFLLSLFIFDRLRPQNAFMCISCCALLPLGSGALWDQCLHTALELQITAVGVLGPETLCFLRQIEA